MEGNYMLTGYSSDIFVGSTLCNYKHVSQQVSYRLYETIKVFTLTPDLLSF